MSGPGCRSAVLIIHQPVQEAAHDSLFALRLLRAVGQQEVCQGEGCNRDLLQDGYCTADKLVCAGCLAMRLYNLLQIVECLSAHYRLGKYVRDKVQQQTLPGPQQDMSMQKGLRLLEPLQRWREVRWTAIKMQQLPLEQHCVGNRT